jgi:Protein of unknown function (DUF4233)
MTGQPEKPDQPAASPPDPWKGLRAVMAGTLVLEAIVVALALPVIAKLGGGLTTTGGMIVLALAIAMVVAAGLLRTGWGLPLALVLQVVMIACGLFQLTLGILGVMFALIWAYLLWLRRDLRRRIDQQRQDRD